MQVEWTGVDYLWSAAGKVALPLRRQIGVGPLCSGVASRLTCVGCLARGKVALARAAKWRWRVAKWRWLGKALTMAELPCMLWTSYSDHWCSPSRPRCRSASLRHQKR